MPESSGVTSHAHADSHTITKCLYSEDAIKKKQEGGSKNGEMESQSKEENPLVKEHVSFSHIAVTQVKNIFAKGISLFNNLGVEKGIPQNTEPLRENYDEAAATIIQPEENRGAALPTEQVKENTTEIRPGISSDSLKEQLQKAGRNVKVMKLRKKKPLQEQNAKKPGVALENNYLLDSYNKNGEYTRLKTEENSINYRR